MHLIFEKELGFVVQSINISTQKINSTTLETYGIVVAIFWIIDQANKVRFFKKTFLVASVNPDVVFEMLFLTLSDVDINILKTKLW